MIGFLEVTFAALARRGFGYLFGRPPLFLLPPLHGITDSPWLLARRLECRDLCSPACIAASRLPCTVAGALGTV